MLLSAFFVVEIYHYNFIDVAAFNSFPFLYSPALVLALLNMIAATALCCFGEAKKVIVKTCDFKHNSSPF